MEFWLSRSVSHEPFLFSWWNSGYQGAFHTNFSFFTMEFWLSRSLSHKLFFFTMEFWLSRSLSHEFFIFSWWNPGYQGAFHTNFSFFTMEFTKCTIWGKTLFIYIYIYITKSIYIGSASLKTLPLDLEPPLQGKEYDPPYSNATKRRKAIVFSQITYRHVIRLFKFFFRI
jgi:hypothetical protein